MASFILKRVRRTSISAMIPYPSHIRFISPPTASEKAQVCSGERGMASESCSGVLSSSSVDKAVHLGMTSQECQQSNMNPDHSLRTPSRDYTCQQALFWIIRYISSKAIDDTAEVTITAASYSRLGHVWLKRHQNPGE